MKRTQCTHCKIVFAMPGYDRCWEHLDMPDRSALLASQDEDVRALAVRKMESTAHSATLATGSAALLVCPHCQERGRVTSESVKVKKGVSGGKLTGAILTGGVSMLGTGLSRKEIVTQRRCSACGTTWQI